MAGIRSVLCFFFILLFISSYPLTAAAQNARDPFSDMSLEALLNLNVDVASLFVEDEQVVGSTVSAIDSEKWKQRGARRFHEALENEMSVMTYPSIGGSPAIAVRGYASTASLRGLATTLDGVPLNSLSWGTAFYQLPNWELGTLNRIEMIKGPGSAIYGSDAFHGVISMKTFESDENHCSAEAAAGYPGYNDGNIKISHGITDTLRIDMAGGFSRQGDLDMDYDYNDTTNLPELMTPKTGTGTRKYKYNSESGTLKLRLEPSDNLEFKLGAYAAEWTGEDFSSFYMIGGGIHTRDADTFSSEGSLYMANGSVSYGFPNDITVEGLCHYWEGSRENEFDIPEYGTVILDSIYGIPQVAGLGGEEDRRFGATLMVKQPDNALNLQWLFAYSYADLDVLSAYSKVRTPSGEIVDWVYSDYDPDIAPGVAPWQDYSRDINSLFGQIKWGFYQDQFYFLAGGRYDRYSDLGGQFTPRCGLIYLPTESSSLKALYGNAFRAPTAGGELTMTGGLARGNADIKPEEIDIYELIYMYKGDTWKFDVTGFYSRWTNAIITLPNPDPDDTFPLVYDNAGKNRSYGGEGNLVYPMKPFTFDVGLSFVKSEAMDVSTGGSPSGTMDQQYDAFPKWTVRAGILFYLESFHTNFYLNNRVHMDWKDAPSHINPEAQDLSTYWRTDVDISKRVTQKLGCSLNIRNLFDRKNYIPSVWGATGGIEEPGVSGVFRISYKL